MNSYNLVEKAFAVIFQGLTVIARATNTEWQEPISRDQNVA